MLSRLQIFLFTPAISFANFALHLTWSQLAEAGVLVLWALVIFLVSAAVAFVTLPLVQCPPWFRSIYILANTFGNAFALPIVVIESVVKSQPEFDNTDNAAFDEATVLLFVFLVPWSILFWSFSLSLPDGDVITPQAVVRQSLVGDTASASSLALASQPPPPPRLSCGGRTKQVLRRALLTPPMAGIFIGVAAGLTGFGRHVLFNDSAPLAFLGRGIRLLAMPAVILPSIIMAASLYRGVANVVAARSAAKRARADDAPATDGDQERALPGVAAFTAEPTAGNPVAVDAVDVSRLQDDSRRATAVAVTRPMGVTGSVVDVPPAATPALPPLPPRTRTVDANTMLPKRVFAGLVVCKCVLNPLVLYAVYLVAEPAGLVPTSKLLRLVLLLQMATPSPQMVLVVCTQKGKLASTQNLALVYLGMYLLSTVTMTLFLAWALALVL